MRIMFSFSAVVKRKHTCGNKARNCLSSRGFEEGFKVELDCGLGSQVKQECLRARLTLSKTRLTEATYRYRNNFSTSQTVIRHEVVPRLATWASDTSEAECPGHAHADLQ